MNRKHPLSFMGAIRETAGYRKNEGTKSLQGAVRKFFAVAKDSINMEQ